MLHAHDDKQPSVAAAASEELYRMLVQSPTELVCRFLPDLTLTFVNDAYCSYFGRSRDELIGMSFLELLPPPARAPAAQHVVKLLQTHRTEITEHEVLRPDGQIGWQQWLDHVVLDPSGQVIELQSVGRDVTHLKVAQLRAEEQQQEMVHLTRVSLLGRMTSALIHELSQPLSSILSNTQAALQMSAAQAVDPTAIKQILQDILGQSRHARTLIQKARGLVRRDAVTFRSLDLNAVLLDTTVLLRSELAASSVGLVCDVERNLPRVCGDRTQLQQVILNLITNARDAMSELPHAARRIVIATSSQEGIVHCSVSDNGVSIVQADLERVFDPFFTTKAGGLGLGLAICRAIIAAHGGELRASRNIDAGATFHFTLPALRE